MRTALITGVVGVAIIVGVRLVLAAAFRGYVSRMGDRRTPPELAGQRTRFVILQRVITTILVVIVAWSVLQVFPSTNALAHTLLASGAVLTIFVGIALSGPLSNIGSGVLLGWSQSVRLGDRVTIADVTGTAVEITLMQTVLVTDEGRRVFVPNSQMASSIVTNRSIDDPRRVVAVRLPLRLGAAIDEARRVVLDAVADFEGSAAGAKVIVDDVTESTAWLSLSIRLPAGSEVAAAAAELRELALGALAREQLLPGT